MADEEVATGTPRRLTVEERNKPILDVVGDQAVGRTDPAELGGAEFKVAPQTIQQEELLHSYQQMFKQPKEKLALVQ